MSLVNSIKRADRDNSLIENGKLICIWINLHKGAAKLIDNLLMDTIIE
jgi:hypothetical protein